MIHLIVTEKLVVQIRAPVVMKKKFLAYKGDEYTIEWHFDDKGESEVFAYFKFLSTDRQKKLAHLLLLLGDFGKIFIRKSSVMKETNYMYLSLLQTDFSAFSLKDQKLL